MWSSVDSYPELFCAYASLWGIVAVYLWSLSAEQRKLAKRLVELESELTLSGGHAPLSD